MRFFTKSIFFSALLLLNSVVFAQSFAQTSTGWLVNKDHAPVKVQLKLTGQVDKEKQTLSAVLNVDLDGDWKTYWRSPGEGGIAPAFTWQDDSRNISEVDWSWPAPKRYIVLGVNTLGYKHDIHFPLQIKVDDINKEAVLKGTLTLPSCTTICVLTDYPIDLFFMASDLKVDQAFSFEYQQAKGSVPIVVTEEAIKQGSQNAGITKFSTYWDQSKQQLVVQVDSLTEWKNADLFLDITDEAFEHVFFGEPKIVVDGKQVTASFPATSWAGEVDLAAAEIHTTIIDENLAVELISKPSSKMIVTSQSTESLFTMFLFALLGGLILNIMPCVLPVLGMKLSSVLGSHGVERSQIRRQFLASSAGIITSFWILAAFLLLLKFSGEMLGWGIQFQNPYFISMMVIITGLFAANMLGLFEIQLPSGVQTWLATKGGSSYVGHYLQGMFATLLATPCSAPFLGSAVAFALGASNLALIAIFTALGLGMALPWLLIAAFPSIAQLLPKPGKWMNTVKMIFALMIFGTCLWLLSLMEIFVGLGIVLSIASLVILIFLTLIYKRHGKNILLVVIASLLLTTSATFIVGRLTAKHWATPIANDLIWDELDASTIKEQVAAGKVVFVDVTADWCVTCKANKIGVVYQDPVYSALKAENIVLMEGDWTVPSDKVTNYLRSYGHFGVPFNIVFGPNAPEGIELSTILSADAVIDAINKAK